MPASAVYLLSVDPNNPINPTCEYTATSCATSKIGSGILTVIQENYDTDTWSDTNSE